MKKSIKLSIVLSGLLVSIGSIAAPKINPPSLPAINSIPAAVKSNIMYVLDDSGSMAWDYLGDEVANSTTMCRSSATGVNAMASVACNKNSKSNSNTGYEAPFMAYQFNKIFFNPNLDYKPPLDSKGNSFPSKTLATASQDVFLSPSSVQNLNNTLMEVSYCNSAGTICKRNGVDNIDANGLFDYNNNGFPNSTYSTAKLVSSKPHYYEIIPIEYCDISGKNCELRNTPSSSMTEPAYVRYCTTKALAASTSVVTGTTCQSTYDKNSGYIYPRFGKFKRVELSADLYDKYANWFTYYRTRINAMKSAVSLTFSDPELMQKRVGFLTINAGSTSSKFLPMADFTQTQKDAFYTKLFAQTTGNSTPLREALSRVGKYYAGVKDGFMITGSGANLDPVLYSCQRNVTILSTDGYWNGNGGTDIKNVSFGPTNNPDGTLTKYSTRIDVTTDGNNTNNKYTPSGGSLADVAMYYYSGNIRTTNPKNSNGTDVSISDVAIIKKKDGSITEDLNTSPHMNTFTISLGLNGFMSYIQTYDKINETSKKARDFQYIGGYIDQTQPFSNNPRNGDDNYCSWNKGVTCNWPAPLADTASAIDDLWHAAVNGRGHYYSAQNPEEIVKGIKDALDNVDSDGGSGASAASSAPKVTTGDNYIFSSTYDPKVWSGDLQRRTIDISTGVINQNADWSATEKLKTKVFPDSDTRTIWFSNNNSGKLELTNFTYKNIENTIYDNSFKNAPKSYAQYSDTSLDPNIKKRLDGQDVQTNLVGFLRGQTKDLDIFYPKKQTLGDLINSPSTYVGPSRYKWVDPGYTNFANQQAKDYPPMVYVGGNDGMLHAFNANTGNEEWAIVPSQLVDKLPKLGDREYDKSGHHQYFVDGQILVKDVNVGGSSSTDSGWRTYLFAGMGAGGNGYIILDITNPTKPTIVDEICSNSSLCSKTDQDLGFTYGNIIATKRGYDDRWVAYFTNGYDSVSGKGILYEYDLVSKSIRKFQAPGVSSNIDQIGLGQINAYYENFDSNNKTNLMYLGGLNGVLYRVDLTQANPSLVAIANATDPLGKPQPISTKVSFAQYGGKLLVLFGTGQLFNTADSLNKQTQSIYTIKDTSIPYGNLRSLAPASIVKQSLASTGSTSKSSNSPMDWNTKNGWMMDLTSQAGERVNVAPEVAVGTLNVVSNVPSSLPCTSGGEYWYYQIDFATGGSIDGNPAGTKYNNLAVGQLVVRLGDSDKMRNIITDSKGNGTSKDMYAKAKDTNNVVRNVVKAGWRELPNSTGN